jgi:hypothetical protein
MQNPADEIRNLKACINDLISILALPAIWTGRDPTQIINTLLDVLLGMLWQPTRRRLDWKRRGA